MAHGCLRKLVQSLHVICSKKFWTSTAYWISWRYVSLILSPFKGFRKVGKLLPQEVNYQTKVWRKDFSRREGGRGGVACRDLEEYYPLNTERTGGGGESLCVTLMYSDLIVAKGLLFIGSNNIGVVLYNWFDIFDCFKKSLKKN